MSWPLSQDYNEAIQSPARNFADPDLKRGAVATNALGLPMPYSGNFADVYEVRCPDGPRWAVKCFTREVPGLHQRYDAISSHLRQARLPFTVDFSYLDEGIRVAGRWFPALKMQWVEGLTLNQFVARAADKPATLEALLQVWARMAQRLRAAGMAHCDLQHGNVLLVPGSGGASLSLKLVDYDGLWVPALAGSQSGEVGHPSYQHPRRAREGTYSPEVDRFPLLLAATALRALKAGGRPLWEKYDNGDNLLFTEADLLAPAKSHLFLDLIRSGDPATAAMANALIDAVRGGVESAPLLEEVMPEPSPTTAAPPLRAIPTATAERRRERREIPEEVFEGVGAAYTLSPRATPGIRSGVPLAAWVGGAAALVIVVGGGGAFVLMRGGGQDGTATSPAVAENRPDGRRGPSRPVIPAAPTERGREPASTGRSDPTPINPPGADIDPNPKGPPGEVCRFAGHTNLIRKLAVSPDGKQLLTAGFDKSLRLWDVATGRDVLTWEGPACQKMHGVAFLPDGRRALSCGVEDKALHLWDLTDGHEIRSFEGHVEGIWYVAISADGRTAASAGSESTVFLWNVETGEERHRLEGNKGGVESLAFSPDGKSLLTGSRVGPIVLWDVATGQEVRRFLGHSENVMGLAFSPDGKAVVSGGLDKTIRVWRVEDGRELRQFAGVGYHVWGVAVSPDGGRVLSADDDGTVRLWDFATGKEVYSFPAGRQAVWVVAFTPNGRYAFSSGNAEKVVRMWRLPAVTAK